MGLESHNISLCVWLHRLDLGFDPQVPAISPTMAACTTTRNQVHCLTQNSHCDELRQRSDRRLRKSCHADKSTSTDNVQLLSVPVSLLWNLNKPLRT